jgi:hypothetical protein
VGRWGLREPVEPVRRQLEAAGANYVGVTLVETLQHLQTIHGLEEPLPESPPARIVVAPAAEAPHTAATPT